MKIVHAVKEVKKYKVGEVPAGYAFRIGSSWYIPIVDFDDSTIGDYSEFWEMYASSDTAMRELCGVACIHLHTQHFIYLDRDHVVDEMKSIEVNLLPL